MSSNSIGFGKEIKKLCHLRMPIQSPDTSSVFNMKVIHGTTLVHKLLTTLRTWSLTRDYKTSVPEHKPTSLTFMTKGGQLCIPRSNNGDDMASD